MTGSFNSADLSRWKIVAIILYENLSSGEEEREGGGGRVKITLTLIGKAPKLIESCDFLSKRVNFRDKLDSSFHVTVLRNDERRCPKSHRVTKKLSQQFRLLRRREIIIDITRERRKEGIQIEVYSVIRSMYNRRSNVKICAEFYIFVQARFYLGGNSIANPPR